MTEADMMNPEKSTNVRSLWAGVTSELFFFPPRAPRRRGLGEVFRRAQQFDLRTRMGRLRGWSWGRGPRVFLAHGWGGRSDHMAAFVAPLLDRGFQVVAFDAPGHGDSSGFRSSIPWMGRALLEVERHFGSPHAVIAHSAGAPATLLAMREGLRVARVAFVAPAVDPVRWYRSVMERTGADEATLVHIERGLERRFRVGFEDLSLLGEVATERPPLLLVHDETDRWIPPADAQAVAGGWPGSQLLRTSGLGHFRILSDGHVVQTVAAFLGTATGDCATPDCSRRGVHPGGDGRLRCGPCQLDHELMHREWRFAG